MMTLQATDIKKNRSVIFAYFAGCIDSDGSIVISKNKKGEKTYKRVMITLCSNNSVYLGKIQSLVGYGKIYPDYKNGSLRKIAKQFNFSKPLYRLCITHKKNLIPILHKIYPYLILKKENALLALEQLAKINN